jgi:hypothetical protein
METDEPYLDITWTRRTATNQAARSREPFDTTGNTAMVAGSILFELLCVMADRLKPTT